MPEYDPLAKPDTEHQSKRQELKRQATSSPIYISLDICNQPTASGGNPVGPPPGLSLYVSSDSSNRNPGPHYLGTQQTPPLNTVNGHVPHYSSAEAGDTYIGVAAPPLSGFSGSWTYQITVSTETDYTRYIDSPLLRFVDSDRNSTILVTERLSHTNDTSVQEQWQNTGGPFSLFVYNASDPMLEGVNQSFCGLATYAVAISNVKGKTTLTNTETGMHLVNQTTYQQFYISGLVPDSSYRASLALTSNYSREVNSNTPGGGGTIWQSVDFKTRVTENCQLIYNLTFCDKVAYSVPTNATLDMKALAGLYDNFTQTGLWTNFNNSLDQIPCNTSNDAKYSLARGCTDCAAAYKDWLCAVSIPRCADFLSPASSLKVRNTKPNQGPSTWPNGTSTDGLDGGYFTPWNAVARNEQLDSFMNQTGPYKEVLPCDALCYNLVQSCPSTLGFACPLGSQLDWGYRHVEGQLNFTDGYPECNFPGRFWANAAAKSLQAHISFLWALVFVSFWLWA